MLALTLTGAKSQTFNIPVDNTYTWTAEYKFGEEDAFLMVTISFISATECTVGVGGYMEQYFYDAHRGTYRVSGSDLIIDFPNEYPRIEHIFERHNEIKIKEISNDRLVLFIGRDEIRFGKGYKNRGINVIE